MSVPASAAPTGPVLGLALQTRLVANETAKAMRLMWRRRAMVGVYLFANAVTYLGINLFIGGGHVIEALMVRTLPAQLALVVAGIAATKGSGGIAEEINGGTLEQTQLSPASQQTQLFGRMAALAIEGLAVAGVFAALFIWGYGLDYTPRVAAIVPGLLTVADALGYGLLMTALTIRVASIGAIVHIFNTVIMAFAGVLVPIDAFPDTLQMLAHFVPTTLGVQTLNATLAGQPLSTSWSDGTLPALLGHTVVLVAAGLVVHHLAIRRAQREGGLSPR